MHFLGFRNSDRVSTLTFLFSFDVVKHRQGKTGALLNVLHTFMSWKTFDFLQEKYVSMSYKGRVNDNKKG